MSPGYVCMCILKTSEPNYQFHKARYERYITDSNINIISFNFLELVITTWRAGELVRERHPQHLPWVPETNVWWTNIQLFYVILPNSVSNANMEIV